MTVHRCLVLIIYMCRKSLFAIGSSETGVAPALATRALELVRAPRPQPAVTAALLTALAAVLDAVAAHSNKYARSIPLGHFSHVLNIWASRFSAICVSIML